MVDANFRLAAVHITVDIQPFGGAGSDEPDAATISTTYALFDPAEDQAFAEAVGGRAASGIVGTTEEVATTLGERGRYGLRLDVPPAGILVKDASFSASIALPPAVLRADGTALLPVLGSYTTDPRPQVFDGIALPTVGGRITVVWQGYQDPTVDLEYWYRKVRDTGG